MKAIVYDDYGPPDMLRSEDVPRPTPGDGEVLVKVHATSINDYDWHLLAGTPFINRIGALRKPKYHVLGSDVAGTVTSVGARVTRFAPGDEVYGDMSSSGFGAFAEYVTAPADTFARKPESLTFEQAAAVPQAGGLAVMAIRSAKPLDAGSKVLVNGAGGGVGTFAVQIATSFGAEVTGVDLGRKLDGIRSVGADHVVDYTERDFAESGETYDLIVDTASHRSMRAYRRSLRPGGKAALIGGSIPRLLLVMAGGQLVSSYHDRKVSVPMWKTNNDADVTFLTRLLEDGSVVPLVDSVYPLSDLADAFRYYGGQHHTGKIVITV